jgi:hypothetical protein
MPDFDMAKSFSIQSRKTREWSIPTGPVHHDGDSIAKGATVKKLRFPDPEGLPILHCPANEIYLELLG